MSLTLDDVRAAARRLGARIHRTPVIGCQSFDDASGHQVFFKCENLQRAGAFKIRGALNKLADADAGRARAAGVVAFSSGNHAQGVALAARHGRHHGGRLHAHGRAGAQARGHARLRRRGRLLRSEIDDREAARARDRWSAPDASWSRRSTTTRSWPGRGRPRWSCWRTCRRSTRCSPRSAAAVSWRAARRWRGRCSPGMQVFGVEPDTANDTYLSMRQGERVTIPPPPTIADGIRAMTPGALTFPVLRANLTDVAAGQRRRGARRRALPGPPRAHRAGAVRRGRGRRRAVRAGCRFRRARAWA